LNVIVGSAKESIGAADMKIQLTGSISLSSSNIIHV